MTINSEHALKLIFKDNPGIKKKYKKEVKFRKKVEKTYIKAGFSFEASRLIAWDIFFKQLKRNKEISIDINLDEN